MLLAFCEAFKCRVLLFSGCVVLLCTCACAVLCRAEPLEYVLPFLGPNEHVLLCRAVGCRYKHMKCMEFLPSCDGLYDFRVKQGNQFATVVLGVPRRSIPLMYCVVSFLFVQDCACRVTLFH